MSAEVAVVQSHQPPSLLAKMAARFSVEPQRMLTTLKATAFRGEVSNEQMMALLIVADQYRLNPWTKEIYAFPDRQNGIVPVIGVDGWARIINEHPQFDGMDFEQSNEACTCIVYRKDRSHPVRVTEYYAECKRDTGPWKSHPRRMLRHKAMVQAARLAFGFTGVYDQDEAERIVERDVTPVADPAPVTSRIEQIKRRVRGEKPEPTPAAEPPPLELDGDAPPAPTYAEVADRINAAKDADALDLALSLTSGMPEQLRDELRDLAAERRAKLG